jgi:hypothetical protein
MVYENQKSALFPLFPKPLSHLIFRSIGQNKKSFLTVLSG